ncbi:MAG TPA: TolC family protein [Kofleriaceae bacterium]|nr:TolC family protein [Kofleriaceae bacterium]
MFALLTLAAMASSTPLTLPQVLAEVGDRAPLVEVGQANVEARRAAVGAAGTWDDATISVMGASIPLPGGESDPSSPPMIAYRIGQPLNLFGRRDLARDAAGAEVAQAEAALRRTQWDARAQAVTVFYELWMNDAMSALLDEQIATLERMRESALARVQTGMEMAHHDVLRTESELAVMQAEQGSLADERVAMAAMLNTLRGHPVDEPIGAIELPVAAPLPEASQLADAAARTPEVASARAMERAASARARLARKMYLPMVMVMGEYEQNFGGMPDGLGVGVSVSIPLFSRERPRNEIAMQEAMARAADREADAMRAMAEADLRMAWSRTRADQRRIDALEQAAIPKLRETIASAEAAYVSGSGSFLALLDSVRELQQLQIQRIQAIAARGVSRFTIDRIAAADVAP